MARDKQANCADFRSMQNPIAYQSTSMSDVIERIHPAFRQVWIQRPPKEQAALANYFLPHRSTRALLKPTRPRILKWYCPFADQETFPSGHRYCINVYTGCSHNCEYCYATYEPRAANAKQEFRKKLLRDIEDLEHFGVPPAPVHLSNSTDPFQPLEVKRQDTRFALERIRDSRMRFTTVTILTKNPTLAAEIGCLSLLKSLSELPREHTAYGKLGPGHLPALCVEVSLAFWRDEACSFYDHGAPPVAVRVTGLETLRDSGILLVLRIDPLFPRSGPDVSLPDFGIPEAQTLTDLESLIKLAKSLGVRHVVYSPVKIVQSRTGPLSVPMQALREVYRRLAGASRLVFRGGS
jgi:DNA repair photolyase